MQSEELTTAQNMLGVLEKINLSHSLSAPTNAKMFSDRDCLGFLEK